MGVVEYVWSYFVISGELKWASFCSKGLSAILSPNTGIVDWAEVAKSYGADFKEAGGDIYTGFEVHIEKP